MNYFARLTGILKDYQKVAELNYQEYQQSLNWIHTSFRGEFETQKVNEAEGLYNSKINDKRSCCRKAFGEILGEFRRSISEKLKANPETMAELNALINLKLTQGEIQTLAERYKNDYVGMRVISEIAERNGMKIKGTTIDSLLILLDDLENNYGSFLDFYDGSNMYASVRFASVCQSDTPLVQYERLFSNDVVPYVVPAPKTLSEEQAQTIQELFKGYENDLQLRAGALSNLGMKELIELSEFAEYLPQEQ